MFHGFVIQEEIVAMETDRYIEGTFRCANAGYMVDVRVSQQDLRQIDPLSSRELEQAVDFVTGINQDSLPRPWTRDDESVLKEWADGLRLDYDHGVILAILD